MWIRFGPVQLAGSYDLNVIDLCRFSLGRTSYEWYVEIGYIYGVYIIFIWCPYRQLSNQLKSSIKWMAALPSCRYTHNGTIIGRLVCLILCGFIDLLLSPFSNYSNCFHSRSTATCHLIWIIWSVSYHFLSSCLLTIAWWRPAGRQNCKVSSFLSSWFALPTTVIPCQRNGKRTDQAFSTNLVDGWK